MIIQRKQNILLYTLEPSELKKKNTSALQQCNGIKAYSNLSRHLWHEANKIGKQDHDL